MLIQRRTVRRPIANIDQRTVERAYLPSIQRLQRCNRDVFSWKHCSHLKAGHGVAIRSVIGSHPFAFDVGLHAKYIRCMSTQVQPPSGTKQVPANGADQKSADKADFSQFWQGMSSFGCLCSFPALEGGWLHIWCKISFLLFSPYRFQLLACRTVAACGEGEGDLSPVCTHARFAGVLWISYTFGGFSHHQLWYKKAYVQLTVLGISWELDRQQHSNISNCLGPRGRGQEKCTTSGWKGSGKEKEISGGWGRSRSRGGQVGQVCGC